MPQLRATIYGRVQKVSFRAYAQDEARHLGLTGWVCNRPDGSVETLAVGSSDALQRYLRWLQRGSPASHVVHVESNITDEPDQIAESYTTFDITGL